LNANLTPSINSVAYINLAEIPVSMTSPADIERSPATGPDVFIRKWLKDGIIQAGRTVTYTVEFGNLNKWPWPWDWSYGSHITELLPEGMTFVEAIGYWDPENTWEPESIYGQQVV
jgi:hypothetical protein